MAVATFIAWVLYADTVGGRPFVVDNIADAAACRQLGEQVIRDHNGGYFQCYPVRKVDPAPPAKDASPTTKGAG